MPIDVVPEFSPPSLEVQTEALGLSTSEVESLITVPIEADLLVNCTSVGLSDGEFKALPVAADSLGNYATVADLVYRTGGTGLVALDDPGHAEGSVRRRIEGGFALGGGIGPTFPIVGGFDLVDGDGDPTAGADTAAEAHGTEMAALVLRSPALEGLPPERVPRMVAMRVVSVSVIVMSVCCFHAVLPDCAARTISAAP